MFFSAPGHSLALGVAPYMPWQCLIEYPGGMRSFFSSVVRSCRESFMPWREKSAGLASLMKNSVGSVPLGTHRPPPPLAEMVADDPPKPKVGAVRLNICAPKMRRNPNLVNQ